MTSTASPEITVRYEGPGTGTEIWGMTQANFSVGVPGRHAKECAILLNDAAARFLAKELVREDTPEARQALAVEVGAYILRKRAESGAHPDSLIMVSVALLQEQPAIMEHLRSVGA
jgi:hypothetical protein